MAVVDEEERNHSIPMENGLEKDVSVQENGENRRGNCDSCLNGEKEKEEGKGEDNRGENEEQRIDVFVMIENGLRNEVLVPEIIGEEKKSSLDGEDWVGENREKDRTVGESNCFSEDSCLNLGLDGENREGENRRKDQLSGESNGFSEEKANGISSDNDEKAISDGDRNGEEVENQSKEAKGDETSEKFNRNPPESDCSDGKNGAQSPMNGHDQLLRPHSQLPKPEAPPGLIKSASNGEDFHQINRSVSETYDVPASIGKFFRDRGSSFSTAIVRRISSFRESNDQKTLLDPSNVTEFHLPGLKVVVQLKKEEYPELNFKGRISFFSRSNCRDCSAVRSFFRDKGLKYVEINVDVFTERERELIQRTGSASVPQIFFNEKLVGGLVALNSLRNSGEFERRVKELAGNKCPENAPAVPVYGFDDPEEERADEMIGIVRILRQRLPIQDRLAKMKLVKNCFAGSELLEVIIQNLDCGRKKAIEIAKVLARKHFFHHVFGENEFEDGNHFYRFLEHEPTIPKCFNFRDTTNDDEPKPAAVVGRKLTKLMSAILEAYASDDRRHLDYKRISNGEEFRRYVNAAQGLQRVDVTALSADERLAFFMNLYNAMVIHAVIRIGCPHGVIDRRNFYGDFHYIIGGHPYSLAVIKNGILRFNRRQPYALVKPFSSGDKRLEFAVQKLNPLIHFGLCNGTRSNPAVRFFSGQQIDAELRVAAREFFHHDGMQVDLEKRTVYLSRILKWYSADFGQDKDILKWILCYLDATKAGLLTHLLSDGGPVNIVYMNYDWSLNT